jgi:hypothetical protein
VTFVDATPSRRLALAAAVDLLSPLGEADAARVTATAQALFAWLVGPAYLVLTPGTVVSQATGQPTGTPTPTGGTMQLHDGVRERAALYSCARHAPPHVSTTQRGEISGAPRRGAASLVTLVSRSHTHPRCHARSSE